MPGNNVCTFHIINHFAAAAENFSFFPSFSIAPSAAASRSSEWQNISLLAKKANGKLTH